MWKTTANADGTIPGTFIGMLATEVRAYVKANPNLDSGMKLPKLLPRFVTSRDWTQAEAIKLLDDVAYYATEPIDGARGEGEAAERAAVADDGGVSGHPGGHREVERGEGRACESGCAWWGRVERSAARCAWSFGCTTRAERR